MQRLAHKRLLAGATRTLAAIIAGISLTVPAMALEIPSLPFATPNTVITADAALWNPQPDSTPEKDIVLPMPGGMAMVFRVAAVPARGLLWSLSLDMGVSDEPGADRALQDRTWVAQISAPFTMEDTLTSTTAQGAGPVSWKASVPGDDGSWFCYLIAKYEVTRGQYRSVMEPGSASRDDDGLPVTDVSWQDAMDFTARWTAWLLENHPDALPAFKGETTATAYVRLPTEVEWEYAARGGQNESTNYSQLPFFTMAKGKTHQDYAVMDGDPLAPIGTRLPNRLGLYDPAGNAAEMTMDNFRYSRAGKLQGSSGGYVCRGGSHLSDRDGILPGRRDETPLFTAQGAAKRPDLGFRPVISGINVPSQERRETLVAEYEAISGLKLSSSPTDSKAKAEPAADAAPMPFFGEPTATPVKQRTHKATPMEELSDLILNESDPVMRGHLISLRARLSESNILQARDRAARAENQLQKCIMTLESARNILDKSYLMTKLDLRAIDKGLQDKDITKKQMQLLKEKEKVVKKELKANNNLLDQTVDSYINDMEEVARMQADDVRGSFQELAALYRGEDPFNSRMKHVMDMVRGHYEHLAKGGKLEAKTIIDQFEMAG